MKNKPKIGDMVFCVTDYMAEPEQKYQLPVTQVDNQYFYAGDFVFEIATYNKTCGVWRGKNKNYKLVHAVYAFVSKDVYDKQNLKEKQIDEIKKATFFNMPCAKVAAIYDMVFGTSDYPKEDWEIYM